MIGTDNLGYLSSLDKTNEKAWTGNYQSSINGTLHACMKYGSHSRKFLIEFLLDLQNMSCLVMRKLQQGIQDNYYYSGKNVMCNTFSCAYLLWLMTQQIGMIKLNQFNFVHFVSYIWFCWFHSVLRNWIKFLDVCECVWVCNFRNTLFNLA